MERSTLFCFSSCVIERSIGPPGSIPIPPPRSVPIPRLVVAWLPLGGRGVVNQTSAIHPPNVNHTSTKRQPYVHQTPTNRNQWGIFNWVVRDSKSPLVSIGCRLVDVWLTFGGRMVDVWLMYGWRLVDDPTSTKRQPYVFEASLKRQPIETNGDFESRRDPIENPH